MLARLRSIDMCEMDGVGHERDRTVSSSVYLFHWALAANCPYQDVWVWVALQQTRSKVYDRRLTLRVLA